MATIINTSQFQLNQVLTWLEQEENNLNDGFYCNKDIIIDSFNNDEMLCIELDGLIVGFGIFHIMSSSASIDILEVHPCYRGNGFGEQMARHLLTHLFNLKTPYITVKCVPESSNEFWRKLGFLEYRDKTQYLYEPLQLKLIKENYNY